MKHKLTTRLQGEISITADTQMTLRWEYEFLSKEPMNGIYEHTSTHGSKQTGFIKEEEITKL